MLFSRILLGLTGIAFAGYGVYCAYDLSSIVDLTGLEFRTPSGAVEARAMYGGLQAGLGLLFINCAVNTRMAPFGLVAMVFVLGGLAAGRALGISIDGQDEYNQSALIYEGISAALAVPAKTTFNCRCAASCCSIGANSPSPIMVNCSSGKRALSRSMACSR